MLSFLVCIGLIAVFLGCASTRTHQSTGEKVDDSVITTKVKAAIFDEPTLKVFQVNVETFKGEVQLSGLSIRPRASKRRGRRGVNGTIMKTTDRERPVAVSLIERGETTMVLNGIGFPPLVLLLLLAYFTMRRDGVRSEEIWYLPFRARRDRAVEAARAAGRQGMP
jgi:hypothetical protein